MMISDRNLYLIIANFFGYSFEVSTQRAKGAGSTVACVAYVA
jgi:hypothetical protein